MKVLECVDSNGNPSHDCDTNDVQNQLDIPTELCGTTACLGATSPGMCMYMYVGMYACTVYVCILREKFSAKICFKYDLCSRCMAVYRSFFSASVL